MSDFRISRGEIVPAEEIAALEGRGRPAPWCRSAGAFATITKDAR